MVARVRPLVSWVAVLGVLVGSTAGCSLSLSGPDPQASVRDTPRCDTGKGAVALDGVMGAVLAVPALAAFGGDEPELGAVLGLASIAYVAAAVRGSGVVDDCRAAVEAHDLAVNSAPVDDENEVRDRRRAALARRRELAAPPPAAEPPADPTAAPPVVAPRAPAPAPAPAPEAAPAPAPPAPSSVEPWREFWKEIR